MDAVYLDYAATTPLREEVVDAMVPYLSQRFGNPSSLHRWGREAAEALASARADVAQALGAHPAEIFFVRGGTESDNLAILGACRALRDTGSRPTLFVSAVEHPAVLDAARRAASEEIATLRTMGVDAERNLDVDALDEALRAVSPDRHAAGGERGGAVVSAMWVNNETGAVLPVPDIARLADRAGAIVHTDASQAVGKVEITLDDTPVHLLTATGHKIYGPKGTGILYVRRGTPLHPLLFGGGQERALRPGTEDVAGAIGFATALRLAVEARATESQRLAALRASLERRLGAELDGVRINAGTLERSPHVSNVGFAGVPDGQALLMALDLEGLAVSGGSACSSGSRKGSHVIAALYGADDPYANVRFSFGLHTTDAEVERAARTTVEIVRRVRAA